MLIRINLYQHVFLCRETHALVRLTDDESTVIIPVVRISVVTNGEKIDRRKSLRLLL